MKDQKRSPLKVGSPTHYNNLKQAEKAPEKIQIQTVEGILEYVHPKIVERLKEENARLRSDKSKLSGALQLLIEAKKWKERYGKDQTYLLIRDKAWQKAKEVMGEPEEDADNA